MSLANLVSDFLTAYVTYIIYQLTNEILFIPGQNHLYNGAPSCTIYVDNINRFNFAANGELS